MTLDIKERVVGEGDWAEYNGGNDQLLLDGRIIGHCVKTDHKSFVIQVIRIWDTKLRSKGYGTKFVKLYEILARKKGFKRIEAEVDPIGENAEKRINFWENKCGFKKDNSKSEDDNWFYYKDL